jgi:ribosomal protein S18 acetylase RimI-like enzyme
MNLKLQLAQINNLKEIMKIIDNAKQYLKEQGSLQWNLSDGYPSDKDIIKDIENNACYIYIDNDEIIGTLSIVTLPDENYNEIYDGKWLSNDKYASIHRIAIRNEYHHLKLGIHMLYEAEKIVKENNTYSIKIDTHKLNIPMTKTILNAGYTHCGTIILKRTTEDNLREAYEKRLD